ncbi:hypothetical protein DQ04_11861010, partial [Trypanosoma grayi]|uniref:hypothetical protein n=1 Tax=Trypanosoma grayi TaxID=71804 RepID=UPI0004F3FD8E
MMATVRRVVWVLAAALCCTTLGVTAAAESAVLPAVGTREAAQAKVEAFAKDVSKAGDVLRLAEEAYSRAGEAKSMVDNFVQKATKAKKNAETAESMVKETVTSITKGESELKKVAELNIASGQAVPFDVKDLTAGAEDAKTAVEKATSAAGNATEAKKLLVEAMDHAKKVLDRAKKLKELPAEANPKSALDFLNGIQEAKKIVVATPPKPPAVKVTFENENFVAVLLVLSGQMAVEQIEQALTSINKAVTHASDAKDNAANAEKSLKTLVNTEGKVTITEEGKQFAKKANKAAGGAMTNAKTAETSANQAVQSIDNAVTAAEQVKKHSDTALDPAKAAVDAAKKAKAKADAALADARKELKKFPKKVEKPETQLPKAEEPSTDHKSSQAEVTGPLPTDQPAKTQEKVSGTAGGSNIGVKDGS